jgi:hypothetical protein
MMDVLDIGYGKCVVVHVPAWARSCEFGDGMMYFSDATEGDYSIDRGNDRQLKVEMEKSGGVLHVAVYPVSD